MTMNAMNAMNSMNTVNATPCKPFETSSRKLEQFLYMHDIRHLAWRKNDDGMTVWQYPDTAEVRQVVDEFRAIMSRRSNRAERSI